MILGDPKELPKSEQSSLVVSSNNGGHWCSICSLTLYLPLTPIDLTGVILSTNFDITVYS